MVPSRYRNVRAAFHLNLTEFNTSSGLWRFNNKTLEQMCVGSLGSTAAARVRPLHSAAPHCQPGVFPSNGAGSSLLTAACQTRSSRCSNTPLRLLPVPFDSGSEPGRSGSEPGTAIIETPLSVEAERGREQQAPGRRVCSSGSSKAGSHPVCWSALCHDASSHWFYAQDSG
ncbi:unnamed protein product [Pleuronectes platessa]|uniref:Uncharacterized protein n=1 Tax=Pleuronectes platessa TaxID=8262 RepID=A0A9N7Z3U2_PLEPL|nr:unnamed protein product [Pleuronectes platessa]